MAYDLIKVSGLPLVTPDSGQDIVVGVGDYAKRINYGAVKADMVGTSPSYTTDTEPYLMRRTANIGVVGKCALTKLVGGSLGWNQLIYGDFADTTHWGGTRATIAVSGGVMTGTCSTTGFVTLNSNLPTSVQNHKVAILFDFKSSLSSIYLRGSVSNSSINVNSFLGKTYTGATSWASVSAVYMPTQDGASQLRIGAEMTAGDTLSLRNVMFIDITTMFGSTIADYVYGLESATAGSGIAWLSKYIDLSTYHTYDAGSIQSVQATEHVTLGKNFLTDFNHTSASEVMNGVTFTKNSDGTITLNGTASAATTYYLSSRSVLTTTVGLRVPKGSYIISGIPTGYSSYNLRLGMNRGGDGTTIGNDTGSGFAFTEPEGTAVVYGVWIGFNSGATFNNVIIRPMVRYATADSTYVPYQKHAYPLGSDTLRGIPQLVSNKLQFDGDEKYPDGTIRRRYGTVDLGTLNWGYGTNYGGAFYANLPSEVANNVTGGLAGVCGRYALFQGGSSEFTSADKVYTLCNQNFTSYKRIHLKDSAYTDQATFKASVSGVYLVYPLATETTESSTAYQKIQTIDADGTESFTTSSPVPVGHETQTPDNVLAALNWLGE